MKIVVKHVDNLKSSLQVGKVVPEYLIYSMTEDNKPISCHQVFGEFNKNRIIKTEQSNFNFTLPVFEVPYEEFKNNILRNEASYVGN